MSRAFVKESTGDLDPLPDLPVSPHPNYVTQRGLTALQSRLRDLQDNLSALRARTDRLDKLPEAAVERDIRYVEARLRSAIPVDPRQYNTSEVAFGLRVTVVDTGGKQFIYEITGEDEADATLGRIAPHSPLARALIGARVGDSVTWRRPNGAIPLEVQVISHADPQP